MDGTMDVQLPAEEKDKNGDASSMRYGVGGIVGYAYLANEGEGITKLNICRKSCGCNRQSVYRRYRGQTGGKHREWERTFRSGHAAVARGRRAATACP